MITLVILVDRRLPFNIAVRARVERASCVFAVSKRCARALYSSLFICWRDDDGVCVALLRGAHRC